MTARIDLTEPIPGAPHISWRELVATTHRHYLDQNRDVPIAFAPAGQALAQQLQAVRGLFGRPIIIHSAYRCPALNRAIGGSATSQHMRFEAADFHVLGVALREVFDSIRNAPLSWGQLILEGADPAAGDASWVHISLGYPYRSAEKSQQCLYYSTRTQTYTQA